jgi:ribose transport system ATP-binding protein
VSQPLPLEMRSVSKSFGGFRALRDVNLTVRKGEIHGLVGQNGSGKSTLAKILAGYHAPDRRSTILIDGHAMRTPIRPRELRAAGVSIVHQDLGLVRDKTVTENIAVGSFTRTRWVRRINWSAEDRRARELLDRLEADIDTSATIEQLGPADRSIVAIARALRTQRVGEGVIVLDEATRALPRDALADLYRTLRQVVAQGGSALLISHNLEEVLALTTRVTVLRDGTRIGEPLITAETSEHQIARRMLGRDVTKLAAQRTDKSFGKSIEVRGLAGTALQGVDIDLIPGEVLGVTGVAGAGWDELPYLLSGARPARAGKMALGPRQLDLTRATVARCMKEGIALVPESRLDEGLAAGLSVRENATLPRARVNGRPWLIGSLWQRNETAALLENLNVRPRDPDKPVGQLSGGNQQKVMLGKWLASTPRVLLLHEPTQAVDVGAREDILRAILATADDGVAVVIASIQPADLAAVCDRVLVLYEGAITDEISAPSEDAILETVYAARPAAAARE